MNFRQRQQPHSAVHAIFKSQLQQASVTVFHASIIIIIIIHHPSSIIIIIFHSFTTISKFIAYHSTVVCSCRYLQGSTFQRMKILLR